MIALSRPLSLLSLLLTSALFGFFYAWVCSTMWGLDAADPRIAIGAMQAMNASVRNAVFAPAFFGSSVVLLITTAVLFRAGQGRAGCWFALATVVVATLGMGLTMAINVPMNEALALVEVPKDIEAARQIWQDYSPDWQFWNQMRSMATGFAVIFIGVGLLHLRTSHP